MPETDAPVAVTPHVAPRHEGVDLFGVPGVRTAIRWSGFPYVLQAGMLVVFVALILLGWRHQPPDGVSAKLVAKCSLVTLLVWGLWWPAMV
jgi:hypothetical protein